MRPFHLATAALLMLVVGAGLAGPRDVAARGESSAHERTDLAALALRPADLTEAGWFHEGAFVQSLADQVRDHAVYLGSDTAAADVERVLVDAGWMRQYVSMLSRETRVTSEGPVQRLRSYVTSYASPEGAARGFSYLEDESQISGATDIATTASFGEESELTREQGTSGLDGRAFRSLDLTFRVGELVAGVTLITYGTAEALEPDLLAVERLASMLEGRLSTGDVDSGLGAHVVRLGDETRQLVTFDDAYYRFGGEDVPLAGEVVNAGRLRTESYADAIDVYQLWQGIDTGTDGGVLYGETLLQFADAAAGEEWLLNLESTLAENPFYGDLRYAGGIGSQGLGDRALALSYVANGGTTGAPRSVLVAVQVGSVVIRAHLVPQGDLPSIGVDLAVEMARAQVACLGDIECAELGEVPGDLVALLDDAQTPDASPISSPSPID